MRHLIYRSLAAHLIGALLLSLPLVGQDAPGRQVSEKGAGFALPIELYRNHIYAKVRVNGSGPLNVILDTGASVSTLSDKCAHELNLKLQNQKTASVGAGEGKSQIALTRNVHFDLGGKEVTAKNVMVVSFAELELSEGHAIDGVLGLDLFDQYVVKIDYEARAVTLYDAQNYVYSGAGQAIPLKLAGGWVLAPVKITLSAEKSIEADFVVDTGSRRVLSLNSPLVIKEHVLESGGQVLSSFGAGVGGEYHVSFGRVQSVQLGSFVFAKPVAGFSTATQGANAKKNAGEIGGEILRRFTVLFDYRRKQMVLERNSRFADPFEEDMCGLVLQSTSRDFSTFKAVHVLANSPAAEAGLQEGDVLLEIDGRPAVEFNLGGIEQMFRQEGRAMALKVRRGDQLLNINIQTRRLI